MESKSRSCCSSVTCCGMPVEKGCFIFSIINVITCVAAALGSLALLVISLYTWFDGNSRSSNDMVLVYLFTGIAAGSCVASALAITFAIVLILGVRSGNKRYIRAYLIYGIIVVILSVGGCLAFIALTWGETQLMAYIMIPLGVCVIYSLMLLLVHQTHAAFSHKPATHTRLLNTYVF